MTDETIPTPAPTPIQAAYTVIIGLDGTISTKPVAASDTVQRAATTWDIYQTSRELASDVESQLLADRVSRLVISKLQPVNNADDIKAKIIEALSDRGIETPNA